MIVNIKKSGSRFNLPAHKGDAGYDLVAYCDPVIVGKKNDYDSNLWDEIQYIEYDTNVFIQPIDVREYECNPDAISTGDLPTEYLENIYYSLMFPRSSLSKYNLVLANHVGVIDSGYQGSIKFRFKYFAQPKDIVIGIMNQVCFRIDQSKIYQKGDKIGQLIFAKHIHPSEINEVEEFSKTERGAGGYGSTGK